MSQNDTYIDRSGFSRDLSHKLANVLMTPFNGERCQRLAFMRPARRGQAPDMGTEISDGGMNRECVTRTIQEAIGDQLDLLVAYARLSLMEERGYDDADIQAARRDLEQMMKDPGRAGLPLKLILPEP